MEEEESPHPPDARSPGGQIEITVADDGEGLPAGFSLHQAAGLGLSIVQRLVNDQLKGSFEVRERQARWWPWP